MDRLDDEYDAPAPAPAADEMPALMSGSAVSFLPTKLERERERHIVATHEQHTGLAAFRRSTSSGQLIPSPAPTSGSRYRSRFRCASNAVSATSSFEQALQGASPSRGRRQLEPISMPSSTRTSKESLGDDEKSEGTAGSVSDQVAGASSSSDAGAVPEKANPTGAAVMPSTTEHEAVITPAATAPAVAADDAAMDAAGWSEHAAALAAGAESWVHQSGSGDLSTVLVNFGFRASAGEDAEYATARISEWQNSEGRKLLLLADANGVLAMGQDNNSNGGQGSMVPVPAGVTPQQFLCASQGGYEFRQGAAITMAGGGASGGATQQHRYAPSYRPDRRRPGSASTKACVSYSAAMKRQQQRPPWSVGPWRSMHDDNMAAARAERSANRAVCEARCSYGNNACQPRREALFRSNLVYMRQRPPIITCACTRELTVSRCRCRFSLARVPSCCCTGSARGQWHTDRRRCRRVRVGHARWRYGREHGRVSR